MSIHPGAGEGVIPVTFRLPAEVTAVTAHVVGDFNDWSTDAHPMDRDDRGFHVEVALEAGRRYQFRYLLDDERWENDWAADDYVPNEFGGTDSVLDLTSRRSTTPSEQTGGTDGSDAGDLRHDVHPEAARSDP
jgi:1,4-alpha-glucan branching enzyme